MYRYPILGLHRYQPGNVQAQMNERQTRKWEQLPLECQCVLTWRMYVISSLSAVAAFHQQIAALQQLRLRHALYIKERHESTRGVLLENIILCTWSESPFVRKRVQTTTIARRRFCTAGSSSASRNRGSVWSLCYFVCKTKMRGKK